MGAYRGRETTIRRLKLFVPALFLLGFGFVVAITVYPLAGMPGPPLTPTGGLGRVLVWLGFAGGVGGLFALFGALVIAVSGGTDEF